jgi:hypothetical protein
MIGSTEHAAGSRRANGPELKNRLRGGSRCVLQAELRDIERAVTAGTREPARGLKSELGRQVASSGLGQRLGNSWRDKHYPN